MSRHEPEEPMWVQELNQLIEDYRNGKIEVFQFIHRLQEMKVDPREIYEYVRGK